MKTKMQSGFLLKLITALLAGSLVLSACVPAVPTTSLPDPTATEAVKPTEAAKPTEAPKPTSAVTATAAPSATVVPAKDGSLQFSLVTGSIATAYQTETVAAVTDSDNNPYWMILPAYTRVTLQGYPISKHMIQPQIFIYPVKELGQVSEGAGKIAASLKTLIQSPQEIPNMPFLPLYNASQVMHTHIQYLDFKGGQGLRYLTQFDQAPLPINNNELIYTYQGLTSDGKYYVAAVLPLNHASLPADGKVTGKEPAEFTSNFPSYVANVAKNLNTQAANTFTPDLTQLDAMFSSLEIK